MSLPLIPATFLQSGLFIDRLKRIIFLHDKSIFNDTQNPVCLALFGEKSNDIEIFFDSKYIGKLGDFNRFLPVSKKENRKFIFNDPNGKLGFIALDNTREPSIRFCAGDELEKYNVGFSSRMITRIGGDFKNVSSLSEHLNKKLFEFRNSTKDVFLTPFKGLRKDGMYRSRMDYGLARDFIAYHA